MARPNDRTNDLALYEQAENLRDWTLLRGHPRLLFTWQLHHPKDLQPIAAEAHIQLESIRNIAKSSTGVRL